MRPPTTLGLPQFIHGAPGRYLSGECDVDRSVRAETSRLAGCAGRVRYARGTLRDQCTAASARETSGASPASSSAPCCFARSTYSDGNTNNVKIVPIDIPETTTKPMLLRAAA